mgnify:CR=1 FL=1
MTFSVAIAGRPNVGKSSLLNSLTGSGVLVENALFATLDPTTRRAALDDGREYVLTDTVGFVRDLPHHLVASFRSTLAEALHANLLIHVVDAAHPDALDQVEAVTRVLSELGAEPERIVGALNKCDQLNEPATLAELRTRFSSAVTISAHTGEGLDKLADALKQLDPSKTYVMH